MSVGALSCKGVVSITFWEFEAHFVNGNPPFTKKIAKVVFKLHCAIVIWGASEYIIDVHVLFDFFSSNWVIFLVFSDVFLRCSD